MTERTKPGTATRWCGDRDGLYDRPTEDTRRTGDRLVPTGDAHRANLVAAKLEAHE